MKRKLNERNEPEPPPADDAAPAAPTTAVKKTGKVDFADLGLDPRLLQAIHQQNFEAPTPIQARAIPPVLQGQGILARAKTGSGKTLAYLLPILHSILLRKDADKRAKATTTLILVPTNVLAAQVTTTINEISKTCGQVIKGQNITRKEDTSVTKARLAEYPDIVVATPARAAQCINEETLQTKELKHVVVDEADLLLSYGHEESLSSIAGFLPPGVQTIMMSATIRTEVGTVSSLFFGTDEANKPTILDMSSEEAAEAQTLTQYKLRTAEDEKFLLIYAIFKLNLIPGKIIMFVADIDRCYRVKLFLEQFGVRSCVLNSELPVNNRLHVVEEFNRGVYDIIIAADEGEVMGNEHGGKKRRKAEEEAEEEDEEQEVTNQDKPAEEDSAPAEAEAKPKARPKRQRREDREYGVSRGIDFRNVTCVLNFDLPLTAKSYTHRIGRTARGGQNGMALSFYVPTEHYRKHKPTSIPQCENDEETMLKIEASQSKKGREVKEWGLNWDNLAPFRYRLADALRGVTRIAVREARTSELRHELVKSEKLKRHFEENPQDLRHLRHDTETHAVRAQPHLRHVPDYLLPAGGTAAVSRDVGFVGLRKDLNSENRIRKARAFNKGRGKGRLAERKRRGGGDPLKTLNVMGRKKK
ncbi:P-loop containing nucleoside triphosphate hydrolase protein [Dissoconium aciculare CBS 342.82]|uniref:RNA helicase n=1 Tax=Dissoconium aciculare CBS 342.82 TaxID=1314786 RepID=A0A6J3LSS8_9PEZI|nr:P-loop containing nucleoside triphosphate hydrolase protein [Dissoconium aciculare CBS 342.82]KAF1818344.1 P-loop containing nucleoside triphosphate hydrolase protein [Dissoconium aciculare CBS 342.82]